MRRWFRKLLGNQGERLAARYLRRAGFRILARQYGNRWGEIDLIALDEACIVFVEVKTRRSNSAGHPTEAVTLEKQRKLTRMALAYLKRNNLLDRPARFDVIAILWPPDSRKPIIEHIRNAFSPTGFGQMYS